MNRALQWTVLILAISLLASCTAVKSRLYYVHPLDRAAYKGDVGEVKALLAKGADIDAAGANGTALNAAAGEGHTQIVIMLLDGGAMVDPTTKSGWTPLMQALGQKHIKIAQILLDHDANVNVRSKDPVATPLIMATQINNLSIVRQLLAKDAKINVVGHKRSTALLWAARHKNYNMVKILLDKGANPNVKGRKGLSALFLAAKNGLARMVEALLDKGADPNAQFRTTTPLRAAKGEPVRRLLRAAGGKM